MCLTYICRTLKIKCDRNHSKFQRKLYKFVLVFLVAYIWPILWSQFENHSTLYILANFLYIGFSVFRHIVRKIFCLWHSLKSNFFQTAGSKSSVIFHWLVTKKECSWIIAKLFGLNKNYFPLWSITSLSVIVMQECRNVLWLVVEKDVFVMAVSD